MHRRLKQMQMKYIVYIYRRIIPALIAPSTRDQILQDGDELFHLKRLYCWDSNPIKSFPTERETKARAESVLPMRSDRRMTDNIRCDV